MVDIRKRDIEDAGASSCASTGDNNKIPKIAEVEASQFPLRHNFHPNMDPKMLKQFIANRIYSQRNKQKKAQYVSELEKQAKSLQTKIGLLHSQIEAYQQQKRSLLIEQHTLKLRIAVQEKERVLQEVEIEKKKAEVIKQNELLSIQLEALTQMMPLHSSSSMRPISNSNSIPWIGLGQMVSTNSDQAQNGEEKPKEVKKTEELEKQGQRFKVKSEPET